MMRFLLAACAVVAAVAALGQERSYTITLPESQLNVVGKALGKLPAEDSFQALSNILNQVNAQKAAASAAADAQERALVKKQVEDEEKAKKINEEKKAKKSDEEKKQ